MVDDLLQQLAARLTAQHIKLATAESCTGGWIAKCITDLAGSSDWFDLAVVSYSNEAKMRILGVPAETLQHHGAVSEQTVLAMARGVLACSSAGLSVAVSGIAGPGGGSADKPVGTVWFAWCRRDAQALAEQRVFEGDREAVRRQAVAFALQGCINMLGEVSESA